MRPILISILGLDVQTYGVSKAAAAIVAAYVLARAFRRHGLARDDAYGLVTWATVWGFVGAKIYFILERLPDVTPHDLGGSGFTWYGGLLGGTAAALIMIRRRHLPFGVVVDATACRSAWLTRSAERDAGSRETARTASRPHCHGA